VSRIIYPTETRPSAIEASWFDGATVSSVTLLQQHVWVFAFSTGASVTAACLWRIVGASIILTSEDHEQRFGLPAPVDAVARASELIVGDTASDFTLHGDTLDLIMSLSGGHRLEILPTSAGYEVWHITSPQRQHFIALGGGRLTTYTDEA
jgi:hypothetical protein